MTDMVVPVHIGFEHPNLIWLVVVGILTFIAGLGVNLYHSTNKGESSHESTTNDERVE